MPYGSLVKAETSEDIQQDYRKTMNSVKEEIEKGNTSTPEEVQAYQEFIKKY